LPIALPICQRICKKWSSAQRFPSTRPMPYVASRIAAECSEPTPPQTAQCGRISASASTDRNDVCIARFVCIRTLMCCDISCASIQRMSSLASLEMYARATSPLCLPRASNDAPLLKSPSSMNSETIYRIRSTQRELTHRVLLLLASKIKKYQRPVP
jgi:hypothetical protein